MPPRFAMPCLMAVLFLVSWAPVASAANNPEPCSNSGTVVFDKDPIVICRGDSGRASFRVTNTGSNVATYTSKVSMHGGTVTGALIGGGPFTDILAPGAHADHAPEVLVYGTSPRGQTTVTVKVTAECMDEISADTTVQVPSGQGTLSLDAFPTLCYGGSATRLCKITNTGSCRETYTLTMALSGSGLTGPGGNSVTISLDPGVTGEVPVIVIAEPKTMATMPDKTALVLITCHISDNDGPDPDPVSQTVTVHDCNPGGPPPPPPPPPPPGGGPGFGPPVKSGQVVTISASSPDSLMLWANLPRTADNPRNDFNVSIAAGKGETPSAVGLLFQYPFSDPTGDQLVKTPFQPFGIPVRAPGALRLYAIEWSTGKTIILRPGVVYPLGTFVSPESLAAPTNPDVATPIPGMTFFAEGIHETDQPVLLAVTVSGLSKTTGSKIDTIPVNVGRLDLIIDADNTNGPTKDSVDPVPFQTPDESDAEELAKHYAPGKIVPVNNGDTDLDGVPDYAAGFDYTVNGKSQSVGGISKCFVPFKIKLLGSIPNDVMAHLAPTIAYDKNDPATINQTIANPVPGLAFTGDVATQAWNAGSGRFRVWRRDGNQARTLANDLVDVGSHDLSYYGLSAQRREALLYIECVQDQGGGALHYHLRSDDIQRIQDNLTVTLQPAFTRPQSIVDGFIVTGLSPRALDAAVVSLSQVTLTGFSGDLGFNTLEQARQFVAGWQIDWSGVEPAAYLLDRTSGDPTTFHRPSGGQHALYSFTATPASEPGASEGHFLPLTVLGGYVVDQPEPRVHQPVRRAYAVRVPTLRGMMGNPALYGEVVVSPVPITITNVYNGRLTGGQASGAYLPPPYGSPSLLGGSAAVTILSDANLRDRALFDFDANPVNGFLPLKRSVVPHGDNGSVLVTGWTTPNSFLVTGIRPGADVFEIDAKIDGGDTILAYIPVEVEVLSLLEPDLPQVDVAIRNTGRYLNFAAGRTAQLDEVPTPVPGDAAYRLPKEGDPLYANLVARNLYASVEKNLFMAGQILPWMEPSGWTLPFVPSDPVGFASDSDQRRSELSLGDVRRMLTGTDADARVAQLLQDFGGPAINAWRRCFEAEKATGGADLPIATRRTLYAVKAKEYLTSAVNDKLLLNFTMVHSPDEVPRGPWSDFRVVGGQTTIRAAGFWESALHYNSPIQDLFQTGVAAKWDIGNSYTEQAINHMIAERWLLANLVYDQLRLITGGPGSSEWPLKADFDLLPTREVAWPRSFDIDMVLDKDKVGNYVFFATDAAKVSMASLGISVKLERQAFSGNQGAPFLLNWTSPTSGVTYQAVYRGAAALLNVGATSSLAQRYGQMLALLLRDVGYLQEMEADAPTVAWWLKMRHEQPLGFGLFTAGDFLFGAHDMLSLPGRDFVTGEALTPAEYGLTAGSVAANIVPGSVLLRGGRQAVLRARKVGAMMKGALGNIGKLKLAGVPKWASPKLLGAMQEMADVNGATVTVIGDAAYQERRSLAAGAGLERIGKAGLLGASAADRAFDVVANLATKEQFDTVLGLTRGAGRGSVTSTHVAGATIPEISGRGLRVAGPQPPRSLATAFKGGDLNPDEVYRDSGQLIAASTVGDAALTAARTRNLSAAMRICEQSLRNGCFVAGTQVVMGDGTLKEIERIQAGDLVRSRDQADPSGTFTLSPVKGAYRHVVDHVRRLTIVRAGNSRHGGGGDTQQAASGETPVDGEPPGHSPTGSLIVTTDEHPFWLVEHGWVPAKLLRPGDRLLGEDGVYAVAANELDGSRDVPVYNLYVQGTHTYLVAGAGRDLGTHLWVHNAACAVLDQIKDYLVQRGFDPEKVTSSIRSLQDSIKLPIKAYGDLPDIGDSTLLRDQMGLLPTDASGIALQAHHIHPTSEVGGHPLFQGGVDLGNGVSLPPLPFLTNDPFNGIALPSDPLIAAERGVPRHWTRHTAYNDAMARQYDVILQRVVAQYHSTGDIVQALALRDQLLSDLTMRARSVIEGLGANFGKQAIPLHVTGGDTLQLTERWFVALSTGSR